jgi:hypothetical protein
MFTAMVLLDGVFVDLDLFHHRPTKAVKIMLQTTSMVNIIGRKSFFCLRMIIIVEKQSKKKKFI